MNKKEIAEIDLIQNRIYTIRGVQVMLDENLAELYEVETKILNRAVKRNVERFPEIFRFQLDQQEFDTLNSQVMSLNGKQNLRFQSGTSSGHGGRRYLPYVFTEQGVAMLSAVLRSDIAVNMSVQIMSAFVSMRRFMVTNAQIFQRLDTLEVKQLAADKKIEQIFNAIEEKDIKPRQGIFFDGQIFDAYKFISDLFRSAKRSIVIIDNYLDDTVLAHVSKRRKNVSVLFLTKAISKTLALDVRKFNEQHPEIEIKEFKNAHDRFIIIDDNIVYHLGASLKDLGKKWFAFSRMDIGAVEMLSKIQPLIR